jgi:uncharacterized protein
MYGQARQSRTGVMAELDAPTAERRSQRVDRGTTDPADVLHDGAPVRRRARLGANTDRMASTVIRVKIKPNVRASELQRADTGEWRAQLKSPPVGARANDKLIALVAKHFKCPKTAVSLKRGASGRTQWIRIERISGARG